MVVRETAAMIAGMSPELASGEFMFCATADPALAQRCAAVAVSMFREKEGPSFILPAGEAATLGFARTAPMRQITLNVLSALDGVGLTAAVAGTLAERGIPCNTVAAHYHDHLFVPTDKAEEALSVLLELSAAHRRPPSTSVR